MDDVLPYRILNILRDLYVEEPTSYVGLDYFEDTFDIPTNEIHGALIYLKEKDWIKSFKDSYGEWVQRINAKGMDELNRYEKIHQDDNEPLEFDVSHEDHEGKIQVFISHKFVKSDQKLAQTLEHYLNEHDMYGYLAERKKEYDVVFGEKIKKEIRISNVLIAIITKHSHLAPSVHQEIGYAMGIGIPVRIMAEKQEVKGVLVEGKDIEIFSRDDFVKSLDNIIQDIEKNGSKKKLNNEDEKLSQKPVFAFMLSFINNKLNLKCVNIGNGLAKNIELLIKTKKENSLKPELKITYNGLAKGDNFIINNWQKPSWTGVGYYNFDCEISGSCKDIFNEQHTIDETLHFEGGG